MSGVAPDIFAPALPPSWGARLATLVVREQKARFAGGALGYLWAYITPIIWIGSLVVLFRLIGRNPPIHAPAEIFVATGVLPYVLFRQTITSISRAGFSHRYLLHIAPTSINDLLLASALLDLLSGFVTAVVLFVALSFLLSLAPPNNPELIILALTLNWWLALGLGRFLGVLGLVSDTISRISPILLRPIFWVSGIFYTATELPGALQNILWFSPTLHSAELMREGYFLGYTSPIATAVYPLAIGAVFYIVSFPLLGFVQRRRMLRYRV